MRLDVKFQKFERELSKLEKSLYMCVCMYIYRLFNIVLLDVIVRFLNENINICTLLPLNFAQG